MTKADLVAKISDKLGIEKGDVQATVETFMEEVKTSLEASLLKQELKKRVEIFLKIQLSKYQLIIFLHLSQQKFL